MLFTKQLHKSNMFEKFKLDCFENERKKFFIFKMIPPTQGDLPTNPKSPTSPWVTPSMANLLLTS
jgi:hypothetical protein